MNRIVNSIRLPHFSASAEKTSVVLPVPKQVIISMSQHGGAPCVPVVKVGDAVTTGQLIGDNDAYISAPIHSSITGTVVGTTDIMHISGKIWQGLVIERADIQTMCPDIKPPVVNSREDFIKAVRASGSVGLGGAGFPTHVKMNYDPKKTPIDTLVINGAECEPYITSDYREFMENSDNIFKGIKLVMKYLDIKKAVIGIEGDKPKAINVMRALTLNEPDISVKTLKMSYPQGAEKVLIYTTTGRVMKEGELPMNAGCLVMNSSSIAFIAEYIKTGVPLIKRRLTLDGNIVNRPVNVIAPIGTPIRELIEFADTRLEPDRIIAGGPMMGSSVYNPDSPTMKTNNAMLMFAETKACAPTDCIRCGRCVRACSLNLSPTEIEHAFDARDKQRLEKLKVGLCMNCGACSFVCPAKRNLSEKNQLAKAFLKS